MRTHLFILCSHSSGSTALARLLQTSPNVSALPVEGQHIEAVSSIMRQGPWNPATKLPWPYIQTEWAKVWDLDRPILLEKSPPNLIRAFDIEAHFENACFIVMTRDPYAYCEGTKRRGRPGLGYGPNAPYRSIAEGWIREGRRQIKNIENLQRVVHCTYETLTTNPAQVIETLLSFLPELERLDPEATFTIHSLQGYVERPLTNLNPVQIARLSAADIAEINSVLEPHPDVMAFFGYRLLAGAYHPAQRVRLSLASLYTSHVTRTVQRALRRLRRRRAAP